MEEPNRCYRYFGAAALILYPTTGLAYIGPGLGVGALALILGIFGSILLALLTIFWYPFKRILKRWKQKRAGESQETDGRSKTGD